MNQIILPTYITNLPSTGEQIKFRPFTIKEEKTLLLALEENDVMTVVEAIKNIITACTFNKLNVEETPYYDMEYLFLKIRAKSVGEIIDMLGECDCGKDTPFEIDIDETVVEPKPTGKFKTIIPDTKYHLELRHPSITEFATAFKTPDQSGTDIVAGCIKTVYTDEEVFDWSYKEKCEFIDSMTPKQQKDIVKFLDEMPTVKLNSSYRCNSCGTVHEKTLSGFENFFV